MQWIKDNNKWVAEGINGKFVIIKVGICYQATYYGKQISFNFPWNRSIKKVKEMCQNNFWWEE